MKKELTIFIAVLLVMVVGVSAATLDVDNTVACNDTTGTPYCTIQAAVNAAIAGDTINVATGTYAESVLIDKTLILNGVGAKPIITGVSVNYIVKVDGTSDVVIDNVEVNGGGSGTGDNAFDYGIWLSNTDNVEIKNSVVKNIWKGSSNGIQVDDSINSDIHDNTISSFHKRGIRYIDSDGVLYNNEIIGDNVDGNSRVQNLVNLWGGSNVEIYGNTLYNALSPGETRTWDSPGIFVSSYGGSGDSYANIHDNEIYECDSGIVIGSVYATTDGSSADITDNKFHDLGWGINFEVDRINDGQNTVFAVINYNEFIDNNIAVRANGTLSIINAENNWWGACDGPSGDGPGSGDAVIGNVDYIPWTDCTNVGGEGSDFVALTVPDSIDYGTLYGNLGFESEEQTITLENVGNLDIDVKPVWDSGDDVFKYIKFSDTSGSGFEKIEGGLGAEPVYTTSILGELDFSNIKDIFSKIILTADLRPLKGPQTGIIYFQATEI